MKSIGILTGLFFLIVACSHQAKNVSKSLVLGSGALYESSAYEEKLGILKFNNTKDHSLFAYPVTLSYVFAFNEFLEENPAINYFLSQRRPSSCFYLKIEVRDRGAQEAQINRWLVNYRSGKEQTPLRFVEIPMVSPRPSVKNRISQRGRETWWINETFLCAEEQLDWSKDFGLTITSGEAQYKMDWKIKK